MWLLDDGGRVPISLAVRFGGDENLLEGGGQRHGRTQILALLQHEADILVMLEEPRHRIIVVRLDHPLPPVLHRLAVGETVLEDSEKDFHVHARLHAETKALGHGHTIEAEDEVDDELGPRARPIRAQMID